MVVEWGGWLSLTEDRVLTPNIAFHQSLCLPVSRTPANIEATYLLDMDVWASTGNILVVGVSQVVCTTTGTRSSNSHRLPSFVLTVPSSTNFDKYHPGYVGRVCRCSRLCS